MICLCTAARDERSGDSIRDVLARARVPGPRGSQCSQEPNRPSVDQRRCGRGGGWGGRGRSHLVLQRQRLVARRGGGGGRRGPRRQHEAVQRRRQRRAPQRAHPVHLRATPVTDFALGNYTCISCSTPAGGYEWELFNEYLYRYLSVMKCSTNPMIVPVS